MDVVFILLISLLLFWNVYLLGKVRQLKGASPDKSDKQTVNVHDDFFDQIHDSIIVTDTDYLITEWNKGSERIYGYKRSEMLGKSIACLFPKEDQGYLREHLIPELRKKRIDDKELRLITQSGKELFIYVSMTMLYDSVGNEVGVIGYGVDVTERRYMDDALSATSELNEKIINESPIGLAIYDADGQCVRANNAVCEIVGATKAQVLAQNYNNIASWRKSGLLDVAKKALAQNRTEQVEVALVSSFGKSISIDFRVTPFYVKEQKHLLLISYETTRLRESERALKESENLLEKAQKIAKVGHWRLIPETGKVSGSHELYKIFGLAAGELSFDAFSNIVHPDDRERNLAAIQQGAEYGKGWDIVHRLVCRDGSEKWVRAVGEAITDNDGRVVELIGTVQDITDQKAIETELEQHKLHLEELVKERTSDLAQALETAEKASLAKSDFLSQMSHELRTPLNAILGFGQVLDIANDTLTDLHKDSVREILAAGHHLLELINELLDLAAIESGSLEITLEQVSVNEVLQECLSMIKNQVQARNLHVINRVGENSYFVTANCSRFKQVLLNFLSNAVKYNKDNGSIIIEIEKHNDKSLRILISDTGCGLTAQEKSQLFNSFVRLDEHSHIEGTGIGLVITRHLIELMGAEFGIESVKGEGSTFWVEFPI